MALFKVQTWRKLINQKSELLQYKNNSFTIVVLLIINVRDTSFTNYTKIQVPFLHDLLYFKLLHYIVIE